ncbi:MAG: cytochrome c [Gammaproteobacteria bacterium]|nr:cytochrome c [Gammaproteobacteria bacterium]
MTSDKSWIFPTILLIGCVFMYAGGWRLLPNFSGGMARHHSSMSGGVPDAYKGRRNPLPLTQNNIIKGSSLYTKNCVTCHGNKGRGNGPVAGSLYPPPADLASLIRMPIAQDDYLLWAISEGGVQLKTSMPAFKDNLNEAERWKIIHYLRQL